MIYNGFKRLIPQFIKNIFHLFRAILANIWYGFPSRNIKIIGVTGTNGKTTTVQMIAKILEEAGFRVAAASTINFKLGNKEWVNDTKFTTFSSWRLQEFLKKAVKAGCEYAIVEVTSHALDQNRVWGIDFSVAVATNVTREHLDYHKTMEKYAKAKEKLFAITEKNPEGVNVINLNSEFVENFLRHKAKQIYGYAVKISNFKSTTSTFSSKAKVCQILNQFQNLNLKTIFAEEIELETNYSKFKIQDSKFFLNLPGEFNIENALAATCVGLSQNISLEKISKALSKIKGIPGRMEKIENSRKLEIIVDYAVTPDSLEKLYSYLRGLKKENSKIIAVFGSCGERDRGKRPIMGEIVARNTDFCIVTNEDPYNEDPARIINEVFEGVVGEKITSDIPIPIFNFQKILNSKIPKLKKEGINAFRVLDRRDAIKKALQIAKPGDIVVITGKGAEETMAIGKKRIPWNDPKVIREILQELAKEKNQ